MRGQNKILPLLIAVFLMGFAFVPAVCAQSEPSNDKADVLNKLTIVKGNGSNYNLAGQLKRSEAAAFIVRIMGKEKYVLSNTQKFSAVKFPDVPAASWFAPYVGFCEEQGIIGGYVDGSYGPNDNISEKAFLKIVLGALGYRDGTDFNWNNIYQVALSVGLVTDTAYQTKKDDNKQYTRENVIKVLYNSLNLKKKDTKTTIVQNMIAEGAITKEAAVSVHAIKDSITTSVLAITPVNESRLSIKLNESVQNISAENIQIYESGNTAVKLGFSLESQLGVELILKTSEQKPDKSYTVVISDIIDLEGNPVDQLTVQFTGYRNPEIKSDFFKISKVVPYNKNVINVFFTHPINVNSEIAGYYEMLEGDSSLVKGSSQTVYVKVLPSSNNGVSIFLKDKAFKEGVSYTVKINGELTSVYGVKLLDGLGDSIKFIGKGNDSSSLNVTNIMALSNNTLQVDFNNFIDAVSAQKRFSYTVAGPDNSPIEVSKAVLSPDGDKKGKTVLLKLASALDKTKQYNLTIEYLSDIFKQSTIEGQKYTFPGNYPDKTDLSLVNASQLDATTIVAYFNKIPDPTSVMINSNYSLAGVTNSGYYASPVKVYFDAASNPYMVKLYFSNDKALISSNSYKLKVYSLQDNMGNAYSNGYEYTFTANSSSVVKPEISQAVIIGKDTIRIGFSKEIAQELPNLSVSNYSLEYTDSGSTVTKIPISVIPVDHATFALKFDSLDPTKTYILKYFPLKDYSGVYAGAFTDGQKAVAVTVGK